MKKDHLDILLEDIQSKFDLVLEGHAALNSKIDTKFDELNEKIEHNSFLLGVLNDKVDSVDTRLTKQIGEVEIILTNRVDEVETKLTKQMGEIETKLTKQIYTVETNLTQHIAVVAADLSAHRADTEAHHGIYRVKEG